MKAISGKEFAKILERKGWNLVRVKGSYYIYVKDDHPLVKISLPVHGNKALKIGLLKHFMKLVEITEEDLYGLYCRLSSR